MSTAKKYKLIGPDCQTYLSATPGTFGGHRRQKIYGRLDCSVAHCEPLLGAAMWRTGSFSRMKRLLLPRDIDRARCLPEHYQRWKEAQNLEPKSY